MTDSTSPELAGKVAVVTGSSSGIGQATAIQLAAAGADIVVHAGHNLQRAEDTAREVRELGHEALVVVADFSDEIQLMDMAERAWDWRKGVDIWINNAGGEILLGKAAKASFEQKLQWLWQIDVLASIRLARLIGQRMRQRGSGAIVNIGWDQVEMGMAGETGELFATTKGAIAGFTRSLAKSLAPQVRVNCVAPGWIKTAWGQSASDAWQERAERESVLARWGTPEDVANVIRFLVSPQSKFITGQVVAVNGGRA